MGHMKIIAHRPFRDERSMEQFDPSCLDGFDGVELDLRHTPEGGVTVFHGPIFTPFRRAAARALKPAAEVVGHITAGVSRVGLVLLDVKTTSAARQVTEALALLNWDPEVAFICWHPNELGFVRAARPDAKIFYAVAPLWERRWTRLLPESFFLFNGFPYIAGASRFRPRTRQFNQHNIAVRRVGASRSWSEMPEGVTGVCFHKLLYRPEIAQAARREGLEVAVYGFRSRRDPMIERLAEEIDFAIVDPDLRQAPPARMKRRRFTRRLSRAWKRKRARALA